ncbi:hypothetical protein [Psychromonas algicola]|uniref:hypothetical protein n=1 Tax=Psychromonas algicola TaxID=2555642 RepID=UPI001068AC2B|nr:hypothetical protein [Psychromonas sp. RZ5]TEW51210.1 hypothetical protein E2R67_08290 [Psychromonas sp. RZ5]
MEKSIQHFKQKGFAVLTTVVILSAAGILYTLNMAQSQLIDNRILGNVFRNNEALANAESGVNLILNKLSHIDTAEQVINQLPFTYPEQLTEAHYYLVNVKSIKDDQLQITSTGYSQDKSATKMVSLKVERIEVFDIPVTTLSANGQLKINSKGNINTGCEGLSKEDCRSPGNIAEQAVISGVSSQSSELCSSDSTESLLNDQIENIADQQWGNATSFAGTVFDNVDAIDDMKQATSLFESTFGIRLNDAKEALASSDLVANIDMTESSALSCSEQLNAIDESISIIYIKGDCNIDVNDPAYQAYPETERFTIGTIDKPKMVFFEGGTFVTQPESGVSINGLLYFIPASEALLDENGNVLYSDGVIQTVDQQIVDMSGVRVNGALLSEYNCSHNETDKNKSASMQRFSVRYDKTVLNHLYGQLNMQPSAMRYQFVVGSWRDFNGSL